MIRIKQMMISVVLILFVLLASAYADNQQYKSWAVNLVSVETPKSILNYMPSDKGSAESGKIIKAPFKPFGGMSNIIMVKAKPEDENDKTTLSFIAGEITPDINSISSVVVKFEIQNTSKNTNSFKVGDIHFRNSKKEPVIFSAVSQGGSPLFSKFSELEQKAASGVTITLAPDQKEQLTFLLGSKPTEFSFSYSFLEGDWKEIK